MHAEVEAFLRDNTDPEIWRGADVLEVGGYNVNGRARDWVTGWETWISNDLLPGPDVDYPGDAEQVLPELRYRLGKFDVCVSTETLEHAPRWQAIVVEMARAVRKCGWLVITCAGPLRPPHAADGSGPPHPGEHYANVDGPDILDALCAAGVEVTVAHMLAGASDTHLAAQVLSVRPSVRPQP